MKCFKTVTYCLLIAMNLQLPLSQPPPAVARKVAKVPGSKAAVETRPKSNPAAKGQPLGVKSTESRLAKQQAEAAAKYGTDSEQAAAIWLQLGKFYSVNKKYDTAETALKKAAMLYRTRSGGASKEYANALYWLAANFNSAHQFAKASTAFAEVARIRTALKDWPGVADVYAEQAVALASTGQNEKATDVILKSLELRSQGSDPNSPLWEVSYTLLSRELLKSEHKDMVETTFRQAVDYAFAAHGPHAASTLIGLKEFAELCNKLKDYEQAANLYKQVVEGNDVANILNESVLVQVLNQYLTLLVHLNRYEDSAQVESRLHTLQAGRDLERWRAAVKAQPLMSANHVGLAQVLRSLGRFDEAEAECNAALGLAPDNVDAMKLLEDLRVRQSGRAVAPTPPTTPPPLPETKTSEQPATDSDKNKPTLTPATSTPGTTSSSQPAPQDQYTKPSEKADTLKP